MQTVLATLLVLSHMLLLLQRPMVRLKISEELFVEWRGKWMKAVVTQIDCSLVRVGGAPYCATISLPVA